MPYNTRRKSLSLPSLGIQLPNASRAHRPSPSKPTVTTETQQPPVKKIKRSHNSNSPPPISPSSRPRSTTSSSVKNVTFAERPKSSGRAAYEDTPPPSPGAQKDAKIDTDGIDDDIVTGVIEQLEKTGNRPHLLKELAAVLSTTSDVVARFVASTQCSSMFVKAISDVLFYSSANPAALLSARLATYLRRPDWSTLLPCPLGKELVPVHPRKVYYFLTTSPRQVIPSDSSGIISSPFISNPDKGGKGGKRIISPSLSNASVEEDAEGLEERKRDALSPSPEVDLSTPELDGVTSGTNDDFTTPLTPAGSSFSGRSSLARDGSSVSSSQGTRLIHNHRAASPPLEGDEKEFTQTASNMRMRGMSLDDSNIRQSREVEITVSEDSTAMQVEESEEEKARRNREAAATLFGGHPHPGQEMGLGTMSSPLVKAENDHQGTQRAEPIEVEMEDSFSIFGDEGLGSSWDISKPENVNLDELDDLLVEF
ncbi:hypothetical protein MMC20_002543 [Loxospora ochrophaea]|nr:hypothetical protein [Loxospora ochrophaea]